MPSSGPILLLGGRSEIGLALTRLLVANGAPTVVLCARRAQELGHEQRALQESGADAVHCLEFDADDLSRHSALLATVSERYGPPSVVVVAFGILGDQAGAGRGAARAVAVVHTDYVAHVSILTELASIMRAAGSGQIVVFSSVAGIRVRRANYVYGSAKAGLDGFASGLGDALVGSGVRLLLVRPGFVIGRMTAGMTPAPFSSTPEQVAAATFAGLRAGRRVVWVPPILRPVFAVMRFLPRGIWRRLPR